MNCAQFNSIPLSEILRKLGHFEVRANEREYWYLNPFSNEKTASFKLNLKKNIWYLFSEGIGGNNIDFSVKYFGCDISTILKWATQENFFSFQKQEINEVTQNKNYKIIGIKDKIVHPALINYLVKRKVLEQVSFLKEIHYQIKKPNGELKKYFAVGFPNNSENSFEISSEYWKGCLGKKDLTLIKNGSGKLKIFEGFFDFLSYKVLENFLENDNSDYLILNSISLCNKVENDFQNYNSYHEIEIFLDNDNAGIMTTNKLLSLYPEAKDQSFLYKNNKDLNEYLVENLNAK